MGWFEDDLLPADLCADLDPTADCGCDHSGDDRDDWERRRRRRRAIPIGNVSVDCTPVSFRTPGQAINVVSCPVSQVLPVPVTQTVNVNVPLPNGCVATVPQTQRVTVPVVATVNTPPVQTPTLPIFGGRKPCGC